MLTEAQINKKCLIDCSAIGLILVIMWSVLILVIFNIISLLDSDLFKVLIAFTGILVGTFATASSVAVINHLRKNKKSLYFDETK